MQQNESLGRRALGAVIEAIASDDVSPGAGSAAAVGLALAGACARKAVAISEKHRTDDAVISRAGDAFKEICYLALQGADEDATRFRAFMKHKSGSSAQDLIDSGERLQRLGAVLLSVLDEIESHIEPTVAGDLAAARALCKAFMKIQSKNLQESRNGLHHEP
jgi:Formiminotransferase-cyclodeaminase